MTDIVRIMVLCSVLLIGGIAIVGGASIWYTRTQVQHECAALELLAHVPVSKPANPAAKPAAEQNYEFSQAIKSWATLDEC